MTDPGRSRKLQNFTLGGYESQTFGCEGYPADARVRALFIWSSILERAKRSNQFLLLLHFNVLVRIYHSIVGIIVGIFVGIL